MAARGHVTTMSDSEEYREPVTEVASVAPAALARRLGAGEDVAVLDVRNRDEVEAWHVDAPRFTTIPYMKWLSADVTDAVADLAADVDGLGGDDPIVVVCARGEASAYVASLLEREGYVARNLASGMRGWARVYEAREVDADAGNATLVQYRRPSSGCLSYLVVGDGSAAVVDPLRAFADRYVADAEERGVDLTHAIDTHVHADHVSGVRDVRDAAGAEAVLPAGATERGLAVDATLLADGDALAVDDATLEAIHAPGHTSELTALRVGDVLLTGDALFLRSVPRPDLEGAADAGDASDGSRAADATESLARRLHETLTERFGPLPDHLTVAPGHHGDAAERAPDGAYTASLGTVRDRIDAFGMDREAFVEWLLADMPPQPANYETIVAANLGCERVDEETAFELELGPNNCTAAPADD